MAGRIILVLRSLLCGGVFFLLGCQCAVSATPVPFLSGSGEKLKKSVTDVPGYNRSMGEALARCGSSHLERPGAGGRNRVT